VHGTVLRVAGVEELPQDRVDAFGYLALSRERGPVVVLVAEQRFGRFLGLPGSCEGRDRRVDPAGRRGLVVRVLIFEEVGELRYVVGIRIGRPLL